MQNIFGYVFSSNFPACDCMTAELQQVAGHASVDSRLMTPKQSYTSLFNKIILMHYVLKYLLSFHNDLKENVKKWRSIF